MLAKKSLKINSPSSSRILWCESVESLHLEWKYVCLVYTAYQKHSSIPYTETRVRNGLTIKSKQNLPFGDCLKLCLEDSGAEHWYFDKQCLKPASHCSFGSALYNESFINYHLIQYKVSDNHVPKHISSVLLPAVEVWHKVHGKAIVPAVVQCLLTSVSTAKMIL